MVRVAVRSYEGFRMPALTRAGGWAGGPASESLKGRKLRDGERPALPGRYGDLALCGAERYGRRVALAEGARATDEPGIRRVA